MVGLDFSIAVSKCIRCLHKHSNSGETRECIFIKNRNSLTAAQGRTGEKGPTWGLSEKIV